MKTILKSFILAFVMALFSVGLFAQKVDLRFGEVKETCDGKLRLTLQVRAQPNGGGSFRLGNGNVIFNYNNAALANPVVVQSLNFNNTNLCNNGAAPYAPHAVTTSQGAGIFSLGIVLNQPNQGCPLVDTSWVSICEIEFTITDPGASPNLVFNTAVTGFLSHENQVNSQLPNGNFNNLLTYSPYVAPTIQGSASVCAGGSTTLSVSGGSFTAYNWLPGGQTTATISAGAGSYSCIVTDATGCVDTTAVFTVAQTGSLSVTITGNSTFCPGGSTTISVPAGFATYTWSNGVTGTNTLTVNAVGSYSVQVADASGCTGVALPFTVTQSPTVTVGQITGSNTFCQGQSSTITAPAGFVSYLWSPGNTTNQSLTVFAPGVYTVTVTNANGCTGTQSIDMIETVTAPIQVSGPATICAGSTEVLTINNPSDYVSLLWVGTGVTSPTLTITQPGLYVAQGKVLAGCVSEKSILVEPAPGVEITGTQANICPGQTSVLTATAPAGSTLVWSPGGQTSASINVSPTVTTTFTVSANIPSGCISVDTFTVNVGAGLPVFLFGANEICAGDTLTLSSTPGYLSYTLLPTNITNTTGIFNVTTGGAYTVSVTDAAGCSGISTPLVVNSLATDVLVLSGDATFCAGGTATLNVTAGFASYTWEPGNIVTSVPSLTVNVGGNYRVSVASANGCTSRSNFFTVSSVSLPTVTALASPSQTCSAGTIVLAASGNATNYVWNPGNLSGASVVLSPPLTTGSTVYTVTATNGAGCGSTATVTVTVVNNLQPAVTGSLEFCAGSSTVLSAPAGFATYLWNNGVQTPDLTVTAPGVYSVTVSDGGACSGTSLPVTVTQNPLPTPVISGPTGVICPGATVTLTAPAGFQAYSWTSSTIAFTSDAPSVTVGQGVYQVAVTDGNGCVGTSPAVTLTADLLADAGTNKIMSAGGPGVFIGGNPAATGGVGGYTYVWSPAAGLSSTNSQTPYAQPTATTTYTFTVTDASGCVMTDDVTVTVGLAPPPSDLNVDAIALSGAVNVCKNSSVQLKATVGGGVSPYSFHWEPSEYLNDSSLALPFAIMKQTTTFTVLVTDAVGNTAVDSVQIMVKLSPTINAGADRTICLGSSTLLGGSPTASGGVGPFGYLWNPTTGLTNINSATPLAKPSTTTSYTLTVVDGFGCQTLDTVTITVAPGSNLAVTTGLPQSVCAGQSATLSAEATGGNAPVTFSWSPSASLNDASLAQPTATPSATTTYTVIATDAFGCVAQNTQLVNVLPQPIAVAGNDTVICPGGTAVLGANPPAGTAFTYSWFPTFGLSAPHSSKTNASPSATTTYTLFVQGAANCIDSDTVTVTISSSPTANAGLPRTVCLGETTVLGSPAVQGVSYSWTPTAGLDNPNAAEPVATITANITYTLTTSQPGSCDGKSTVNVFVSQPILADAGEDRYLCPNATNVKLSPNVSGGSGSFSFQWSPAEGLSDPMAKQPNVSPAVTTTYTLTVRNASGTGCVATDVVTVNIIDKTPLVISAAPSVNACIGQAVTLSVNAPGAIGFVWQKNGADLAGQNAASLSVNEAGAYRVKALYPGSCQSEYAATANVVFNPLPPSLKIKRDGNLLYVEAPPAGNYQWFWNDAPVEGGVNSTLLASKSGFYSLQYTDVNGCSSRSNLLDIITDRADFFTEAKISLYPNPTTLQTTFAFSGLTAHSALEVYTLNGQLLQRYALENTEGSLAISTENWAAGVYFCKIVSENKLFATQKLVVGKTN